MLVIFGTSNATKKKFLSHLLCPIIRDRFHKKIQALIIIFILVRQKSYRKDKKMTLKQYLIAGVVEQAIVLGVILPATGWWFSFFALTAVWNLVAGGFNK